jgi:hypothetical protein
MPDITISPDGKYRVEWAINTGRMSHEIWSPKVIEVDTGETVLDLWSGDLDGSVHWGNDGRTFELSMRSYIREGYAKLWVDAPNRMFRLNGGSMEPLAKLTPERVRGALR